MKPCVMSCVLKLAKMALHPNMVKYAKNKFHFVVIVTIETQTLITLFKTSLGLIVKSWGPPLSLQ
jgi:TATA-box binding protein (TBP) (component of TFIID and TFIIIB)